MCLGCFILLAKEAISTAVMLAVSLQMYWCLSFDLAGISHVVTPCTSISEMLKILISCSSFLLS